MKSSNPITVSEIELRDFCKRHHIRRLAVYGSAVTGRLRADSDIDVLVEFEAGHVPGLAFVEIQRELKDLLGREVDLVTPAFLHPRIRDRVVREAEVLVGS